MRYLTLGVAAALLPGAAYGYVGPGAGLGVIAVALAVVVGLVLLFAGFLWYPLKRLLSRGKTEDDTVAADRAED